MRFSDANVLIAGGTGGLGRAVSLAFLAEGARVTATYQISSEYDALRQAAADTDRLQGRLVDVGDEAAVESLVADVAGARGRLDVLVNAVGGYSGGQPLWDTDPATFERMLALNLRPGFQLTRAAARTMVRQGSGAIVNVAAAAALHPPAGLGAYAASKAAAVAMIASLAADLKGSGVRANSVLPSIIDTEANRRAMPDADFSKWPKPEEIAAVILYLSSDAAKLIHGAAIAV